MSSAPFDIDLMGQTSDKICKSLGENFESLYNSHGAGFAMSVIGNVVSSLLVTLLSAEESDSDRARVLLSVMTHVGVSLRAHLAQLDAEDAIAKAMGKAGAA